MQPQRPMTTAYQVPVCILIVSISPPPLPSPPPPPPSALRLKKKRKTHLLHRSPRRRTFLPLPSPHILKPQPRIPLFHRLVTKPTPSFGQLLQSSVPPIFCPRALGRTQTPLSASARRERLLGARAANVLRCCRRRRCRSHVDIIWIDVGF